MCVVCVVSIAVYAIEFVITLPSHINALYNKAFTHTRQYTDKALDSLQKRNHPDQKLTRPMLYTVFPYIRQ